MSVSTPGDRAKPIPSQARLHFQPSVTISFAAAIAFALFHYFEIEMSISTAAMLSTAVGILALIMGSKFLVNGLWSAAGISLVLLILFHLGIFPELIFREYSTSAIVNRWLLSTATVDASFLSSAGILSFLSGAILVQGSSKTRESTKNEIRHSTSRESSRPKDRLGTILGTVGSSFTVIGCFAWMRFAITAGLSPQSNYIDYLNTQENEPFLQLIYYFIGLGMVLACVGSGNFLRKIAFIVFLIFAVWGFPVGLRGEVLFPLASAASILALRRRMPGSRLSIIVATLLLMLIAAVSVSRQQGIDKLTDITTYSPLAALAELGSSIRVVNVMSEWHSSGGYEWAGIWPYWNPTADAVLRLVFRVAPDPYHLETYLSSQIAENVGQIGGSVLASAFHSFGPIGMIVLMSMWGLTLTLVEVKAHENILMAALLGGLTFGFQQQIRNDFASLPVIAILLFFIVLFCLVLNLILPQKSTSYTERKSIGPK